MVTLVSRKLELIREKKLFRLLPGRTKHSRLEASGARIDLSLKHHQRNALLPAPSLGSGFEDICIDHRDRQVFCLVESVEDFDGLLRGFVAEYDQDGHFIRCGICPAVGRSHRRKCPCSGPGVGGRLPLP